MVEKTRVPLVAATRHHPKVVYSKTGVLCAVMMLGIGAIYSTMGERTIRFLGTRTKPSPLGWLLYLALIGIGLLVYRWLGTSLRQYGYKL
jgi:hypothetical protein